MIVKSNRLKAQVLSFARENDLRSSDLLTADMAQNSSNFSTWSSSSDANLCYNFDDCTNMRDSAMEPDVDQSAWLQIERVTAQHCPTQIQFQRPDVLGSVERRYDSGQGRKVDSGFNEHFENLATKNPVDSSVSSRLPNRTRSHAEESFQEEGEDQVVEAPPRKIKTGRRRRVSDGSPDGWVASKNLISERKRREKLQKGLITLRELVPMFTMKVSSVPPCVMNKLYSLLTTSLVLHFRQSVLSQYSIM